MKDDNANQLEHRAAVQREIERNRQIYGSVARSTRDTKKHIAHRYGSDKLLSLPSHLRNARRGQS